MRDTRIRLDGGRLHHDGEDLAWERASAPGGREVVVLCHGAGGNRAVWYQQVPALGARFDVVTWDHRGFGDSTDRAGRSAPDVAVTDLRALLDHLGVERAHVVGQSMGGWTALGFALAEPHRVRSLVLADSLGGCPVEAWFARTAGPARSSGPDRAGPGPDSDDADRRPVLGEHDALGPHLRATDPTKAYLYQQLGGFGRPFGAGISRSVWRGLSTTRHDPAALAALACPVLCIVGAEDRIFPPGWVREAAASFPHSEVVELPEAGHSPYFETPDAWNAAVLRFLANA